MNKKKITLISTDVLVAGHGIRALSSYLKQYGHSTQLVFAGRSQVPYIPAAAEKIKELALGSDLVGISCNSPGKKRAIEIIQILKEARIPVIWGGCYATTNPDTCVEHADYVCVGEGEEALLELVQSLDDDERVRNIKNLWVRSGGAIYKNPPRPLIEDIGDLPYEDYDFKTQYYIDSAGGFSSSPSGLFRKRGYLTGKTRREYTGFSVRFSRCCPYSCSFCHNDDFRRIYAGISRKIYRARDAGSSIEELAGYVKTMCFSGEKNMLYFDDDDFFSRSAVDLAEFGRLYKEKIGLPFSCNAHVSSFREDKLNILLEAGLGVLVIGIQSGSDRINRDIYNRMVNKDQTAQVAATVNKYWRELLQPPVYQAINANPYESEEEAWETIRMVAGFPPPFRLQLFHLGCFPGSHLEERVLTSGILPHSDAASAFDNNYNPSDMKEYRYGWLIMKLLAGDHGIKYMGRVPRSVYGILSGRLIVSAMASSQPVLRMIFLLYNSLKNLSLLRMLYGKLKRTSDED